MGPPSHQPSRRAGPISALLSWGPGTFACQPCARRAAPDGQVFRVSPPPPTTLPSRAVPGSPHDAPRPHTHVGVRVRGHACAVLAAKPPPLSPAAQDGHHLSESPSVHTGCPHTAVGPRHAVNGKLGSPPCLRAIGLWSQLGDSRLAFGECPPPSTSWSPQSPPPRTAPHCRQITATLLMLAHKALAPNPRRAHVRTRDATPRPPGSSTSSSLSPSTAPQLSSALPEALPWVDITHPSLYFPMSPPPQSFSRAQCVISRSSASHMADVQLLFVQG